MGCDQVYIGLGSNQRAPIDQLEQAFNALDQIVDTQLLERSSIYISKPMGPQDQPDFANAVAKLFTTLAPNQLLAALQSIELGQGRERKGQRWGPRTLDLDILLFGDLQMQEPDLTIPHYGMCDREFVLYPLAEISPDLSLPGGTKLKTILNNCARNGLVKLDTSV